MKEKRCIKIERTGGITDVCFMWPNGNFKWKRYKNRKTAETKMKKFKESQFTP